MSRGDEVVVVVVAARRTPIGKFMGGLSSHRATDLGVIAARAAIEDLARAGLAALPRPRVVMGMARQAGAGPNPARQVTVRAGLGDTTPAFTLNMACASGLEAIAQGVRYLRGGECDSALVGGMESMSRVPFLLDRFRTGYRLGNATLEDGMYRDGFMCPLAEQLMGETAETLAKQYDISRAESDAFALESQRKAHQAITEGRFARELVPVGPAAGARKDAPTVEMDEHPRADTTAQSLLKLPPVFSASGTVTAGNSSGITDGAAALILMRAEDAADRGLAPLARIGGWSAAGVDPRIMGIGPVPAVRSLLDRERIDLADIDLLELNEAFAAQVLACDRELKLNHTRLNVNGGAIALGHPIGATGARIAVTLIHEMNRRGAGRGLATLCVSGGMGMAMLFERQE